MTIRPATHDELERLRDIERAAGQAFVTVGRPEIAADEPLPIEALAAWVDAGRAWVAVVDDVVVAYLLIDLLDGAAHIEQVSVHPEAAGQGIGAALIDHVTGWARAVGIDRLTLTTFTEVPWNAPYYERLGFTVIDPSGELEERMEEEAEHGLARHERVAMERPV